MTEAAGPELQVGGTLGLEHLYIRRTQDTAVYKLLDAREYCSILTSRQMGKSSLMVRLIAELIDKRNARVATVDMAGEVGTPTVADDWYIGVLEKIVLDLDLDTQVKQWWETEGRGTANQRLLQFFREVVDAQPDAPVYIFLDEIDATLKLPYSDDFFTAIRSMYNQRSAVAQYKALTFCLIGVATPGELIKDRRTTPYNIGHTIELRDFDPARGDDLGELEKLMSYGEVPGAEIVRSVLALTGGHPFLTIAACAAVRNAKATTPAEVDRVIDDLPSGTSDAIRSHLEGINTFLTTRLTNQLASLRLYRSVLRRPMRDRITPSHLQLRLSGLVKRDGAGYLHPRNNIYQRRFGRSWVAQTKPMRAQARLQRWLMVASGVAVVAVVANLLRSEPSEKGRELTVDLIHALERAPTDADANAIRFNICEIVRAGDPSGAKRAALDGAWRYYWSDRARALDAAAMVQGAAKKYDNALLLTALAGVERGAPSASFGSLYVAAGVTRLVTTIPTEFGVAKVRYVSPTRVYVVDIDQNARLIDVGDKVGEVTHQRFPGLGKALDMCPEGKCFIAGTNTNIILWNAELSSTTPIPISTDVGTLRAVAIDPLDATRMAAGGHGGVVQVGTVENNQLTHTSTFAHSKNRPFFMPINAIAFADNQLVTAALDGIRVFDLGSKKERYIAEGQAVDVRVVGKLLTFTLNPIDAELRKKIQVTEGLEDLRARTVVYDLETNTQRSWFAAPKDVTKLVTSVLFPDATRVVTIGVVSAERGAVLVWRVGEGQSTNVLARIDMLVANDASLSPDGTRLVTAHSDAIRIWDIDADTPPESVGDAWRSVQQKLGKTVDATDSVIAGPPRDAVGFTAETCR